MYAQFWVDILIVAAGCLVGNIVFNNFSRHLPVSRRLLKYAILLPALGLVGLFLGRIAFWSVIGLMTAGLVVVHAWWLPRHGINGLTAEPRERYLELVGKKKGRRQPA